MQNAIYKMNNVANTILLYTMYSFYTAKPNHLENRTINLFSPQHYPISRWINSLSTNFSKPGLHNPLMKMSTSCPCEETYGLWCTNQTIIKLLCDNMPVHLNLFHSSISSQTIL